MAELGILLDAILCLPWSDLTATMPHRAIRLTGRNTFFGSVDWNELEFYFASLDYFVANFNSVPLIHPRRIRMAPLATGTSPPYGDRAALCALFSMGLGPRRSMTGEINIYGSPRPFFGGEGLG